MKILELISSGRLQEKDTSEIGDLIASLHSQIDQLRPQDIINQAFKLDSAHGIQLLNLLPGTRLPLDVSRLSIKPENIENTVQKIILLNYFGGINQPDIPRLLVRFLEDPNKVILFEALKALNSLELDYDVSIMLPYIESMSGTEQALAQEIISSGADAGLVGYLSDHLSGPSSSLNDFFAQLVTEHADQKNIETFLKRLSLEDEAKQQLAIACVQKFASDNLSAAARALVRHNQKFVRDSAKQLVVNLLDEQDLAKINDFAFSNNAQVRERAIKSLGESTNRGSISILKKIAKKWPEDSILVLKAIRQLGFSKGLEVAINCLEKPDPNSQRASLETIEALVNEKHADNIRNNILWKIPVLTDELKDFAKSLIIKITWDYGLPEMRIDENMTTSVGKDENAQAGQSTDNLKTMKPEPSFAQVSPGSMWMDRYHVKKEIGSGAMGSVMLVDDEMVDELLVLKFMRPELTADSEMTERFKREVKYARRIGHKNVIRVHDLLIKDGLCAISMEYFESTGLDVLLKEEGVIERREGLNILSQVCDGMAAAHEQGVIHRDLKPSNILIDRSGLVKVVDFGIASAGAGADSTLTLTGSIVGSPAYLAPERAATAEASERSDIYSLGIMAYYMFAGELPYQGGIRELLVKHSDGGAQSLSKINPSLSPKISDLVSRMVAVDPVDRPQTMIEVHDEILQLRC